MDTVVFMPTRARGHLVEKVLPKWMAQPNVDQIFLVVEKWEYGKHRQIAKKFKHIDVLRLPRVNGGIAFARAEIVRQATLMGLDQIVMTDDDLYPKGDVSRLFEFGNLNTIGIGIMLPFYGLTFGNNTIKERDDPLMMASAMGKRLFSLEISRLNAAGLNFDERLHTFGSDNDIVRDAMRDLAATWYVHAGVHGTSVESRHMPGGLNDLHSERAQLRLNAQVECHRIMFDKWGERYINLPGGRFLCKWRNMLEDFVPNWRERITWAKK